MPTKDTLILNTRNSNVSAPLVGFQIGGAQKCGTNALFNGLFGVPDIALSVRKETHFFVDQTYFSTHRKPVDIARDYGVFFPTHAAGKIAGESTPEYMWDPEATRRIMEYNPKTKWIVCLRNPVARAYSQWKMQIRNGFESRNFLTCLNTIMANFDSSRPCESPRSSDPRGLLTRGLYVSQIERLNSIFGEDQVYILFTAHLRLFYRSTLDGVSAYLKNGTKTCSASIAGTSYKSDSSPCKKSLDLLSEFYAEDMDSLEKTLNCDLSIWRDRPLSD